MAKISASIVCYGGYEEIRAAVDSLLAFAPAQFALYLIDNKSPDDTLARLQASGWDERVQIVPLPKNLGFGRGHNAVLPRLDSDYHFILNPDILVDGPVLVQMADWLDGHPDVVMATPQLYFPDGRVQDLPRRKPNFMGLLARQLPDNSPLRGFNRHYTMRDEDLSRVQDIQFCTGSFSCLRTDVMRRMGGFDEDYFMYVEDADLTQRALRYGRVCLLPQYRAVHVWHRNPVRDAGHFKMQLKSMFLYWRKWGFAFC